MRIGILAQFGEFGGTRSYFEMLLHYYDAQKYDVVVYLVAEQANDKILKLIESHGFSYQVIPCRSSLYSRFPFNLFFDYFRLNSIIRKKCLDLLVISDGPLVDYLGLCMSRQRVIYVVHTYPEKLLPWPYRVLVKRAVKNNLLTILTVSEFAKKNIIRMCLDNNYKDKIKVIYHTILNVPLKRAKCDQKTVLTLGHVETYKNPLGWIKVAKKVVSETKDVTFVWAGNGTMLDKCRLEIPAELASKIKFVGYEPNVGVLYSDAYLYFQPSLVESFGMSVLEALKYGIPCIVSDTGGLPECVSDGINGYVVKASKINEMADKIVLLINDSVKYRSMESAACGLYMDRFSEQVWTKNMQALHENILGRK